MVEEGANSTKEYKTITVVMLVMYMQVEPTK